MKLRNGAGTVVGVSDALAARLLARGWKPADAPSDVASPVEPAAELVLSDDVPAEKDDLIAVAEAEGVDIDRRWGAARLAEAIRQARSI